MIFANVYFDSTFLKVEIHFPIDWVLLRDAARTLMKATVVIRNHGLKNRMPQEPLEFLSEMKTLSKRIAGYAAAHLEVLKARRHQTSPRANHRRTAYRQ